MGSHNPRLMNRSCHAYSRPEGLRRAWHSLSYLILLVITDATAGRSFELHLCMFGWRYIAAPTAPPLDHAIPCLGRKQQASGRLLQLLDFHVTAIRHICPVVFRNISHASATPLFSTRSQSNARACCSAVLLCCGSLPPLLFSILGKHLSAHVLGQNLALLILAIPSRSHFAHIAAL